MIAANEVTAFDYPPINYKPIVSLAKDPSPRTEPV